MKFAAIRDCRRTEPEQRYIHATLGLWHGLPEARRRQARELMSAIALSPEEGRALYDMLARGLSPLIVAERSGVQLNRLYAMRREFYDRYVIS